METHGPERNLAMENPNARLEDSELTLGEVSRHPIIERVAKRVASDVKTTGHSAHNSHYSSNA
jgi:hypothetical protein